MAHVWHYPPVGPSDLKSGLICYSSGRADVAPGMPYPPKTAIEQYVFDTKKGRIIAEYQLVYITKGGGVFYSESTGKRNPIRVKAGDAFMLFPGEWHTYKPDPKTGWEEYWIDFLGWIPDTWLETGVVSKSNPVYHVGIQQNIIRMYTDASNVLMTQKSSYQQALCGICVDILCSVMYHDHNQVFEANHLSDTINYCKAIISENFRTISSEEVAQAAGMGYTKFRQIFKDYTGLTVGSYINEIQLSKAKEVLEGSFLPIKEVALECGFENVDYFCSFFKRHTGETPSQFRLHMRGVSQ